MHPVTIRIRSALKEESFTSGTCKVPVSDCDLYYQSSSETFNRVNLYKATDEHLAKLVAACDVKGRDHTVLRKPLQFDPSQFSTAFDLSTTDILHKVQQDLIETDLALRQRMRVNLFRLDVYDVGACLKMCQDTQEHESAVFGFLVVVFPTPHVGGQLVLSTEEEQWSFDAPNMLTASVADGPEVVWAAFYGYITSQVLPVTSGYRVALTYRLYLEDIVVSELRLETNVKYEPIRGALQELIDDQEMFPAKGILCFGMAHQYSVTRHDRVDSRGTAYKLTELASFLKGSDALVYTVCKDLGLDVTVMALYKTDAQEERWEGTERRIEEWKEYHVSSDFMEDGFYDGSYNLFDHPDFEMIWSSKKGVDSYFVQVTPMLTNNRVRTTFIDDELAFLYVHGDICLIARRLV